MHNFISKNKLDLLSTASTELVRKWRNLEIIEFRKYFNTFLVLFWVGWFIRTSVQLELDLFGGDRASFPKFRRLSRTSGEQGKFVFHRRERGESRREGGDLTWALTRPISSRRVASHRLIAGSSKLIGAPATNSICRKRLPGNALNQS